MKKLLSAVAIAALASVPAFATKIVNVNGGATITVPPTQSFADSVTLSSTDSDVLYQFTLGSALTLSAGSFTNTPLGGTGFQFQTLKLYSGTGTGGTLLNSMAYTTSGQQTPIVSLASGSYTIQISGKTSGAPSIGSSLTFAAPVPEAATWAMMLGGFGLVGGALRTSRRKVSFLNA